MFSVTSANNVIENGDNVIENADKPLINQGTVDNVTENVIENVTERQDSIIRLIKAQPNITIAEIAINVHPSYHITKEQKCQGFSDSLEIGEP